MKNAHSGDAPRKTEHQYIVEHFSMMKILAQEFAKFPGLIIEHSYEYMHMGSWFFIFMKSGIKYQVTWDGTERLLSFLEAELDVDRKRVLNWKIRKERKFDDARPTSRDILNVVGSLADGNN